MRNFRIITWTVWIEYVRRKDFYVVLILTGLFALAALIARTIGIRTADEAFFLMSFGLSLAWLLAGVLTIMLASRQVPREFDQRTLYPLLARPVSRLTFLAGKITGVSMLGMLSLMLFTLLVWLPTPTSTDQSLATLAQTLALEMLGIALLATVACALSLYMPPIVSALATLGLFLAGGPALQGLRFGMAGLPVPISAPLGRLLALVPDFSVFEFIPRYVEGEPPMSLTGVAGIAGYGLVLIALYFAFANWSLSRRQL